MLLPSLQQSCASGWADWQCQSVRRSPQQLVPLWAVEHLKGYIRVAERAVSRMTVAATATRQVGMRNVAELLLFTMLTAESKSQGDGELASIRGRKVSTTGQISRWQCTSSTSQTEPSSGWSPFPPEFPLSVLSAPLNRCSFLWRFLRTTP